MWLCTVMISRLDTIVFRVMLSWVVCVLMLVVWVERWVELLDIVPWIVVVLSMMWQMNSVVILVVTCYAIIGARPVWVIVCKIFTWCWRWSRWFVIRFWCRCRGRWFVIRFRCWCRGWWFGRRSRCRSWCWRWCWCRCGCWSWSRWNRHWMVMIIIVGMVSWSWSWSGCWCRCWTWSRWGRHWMVMFIVGIVSWSWCWARCWCRSRSWGRSWCRGRCWTRSLTW